MTDEGVEHLLELVTDPQRIAAIRDRLKADDGVLIADGHHRYGISRTYRDEVREANRPHRYSGGVDTRVRQRADRRTAERGSYPPPLFRDRHH